RQFAAEALQHDLGRIALLPLLVGPFARLQGTLNIELRALAQVFLGDLDEPLVEDHDAVPFGALAPLARGAVAPALRGREVQIGDPGAVIGRADLGVAAEIADEDDLVDAASHGLPLMSFGLRPIQLGPILGVMGLSRILSTPADVPTLFLSPISTAWGRFSAGLQRRSASFETGLPLPPQALLRMGCIVDGIEKFSSS